MRISVISDTPIIANTLENFLSDLGHEVNSLIPTELPERLNESLQDVNLAILSLSAGKSLIREIHASNPNIMILLLNNGSAIPAEEALSYGVYGYLNKPIRLSELELLIVRLAQRLQQDEPSRRTNAEDGYETARIQEPVHASSKSVSP